MSNILANTINPRSGNLITIGGTNDKVSIAGTLSYEDVTNIDSVGFITAQGGVEIGPTSGIGITLSANGSITAAGNFLLDYDSVSLQKGLRVIDNSGYTFAILYGDGSSNEDAFGIYDGSSSTYPLKISYDGSITAATGQFKVFGSNGQTEIGPVGAPNIFLRGTDGSITAKGDITIASSGTFTGSAGILLKPSTNQLFINGTGDDVSAIDVKGNTIIKGDGSASFASSVISKNGNAYVELAPGANTSYRQFDTSGNVNITMGWDGTITAAGVIATSGQNTINSASTLKISQENANLSQIRAYGSDGSTVGSLEFRVSASDGAPSYIPLTLNNDGSITTAGVVEGFRFINGTDSADPWLKGVNNSGTETFNVNKAGSITAAGNKFEITSVGDDVKLGLRNTGENQVYLGTKNGTILGLTNLTSEITSKDFAIELNTDNGSITAAGPVTGDINSQYGGSFQAQNINGNGYLWKGYDSTGDPTNTGSTTGLTSWIKASGSATFGATVTINEGNFSTNKGGITADQENSSYPVFQGKLSGTETSVIKADGSATFAGDITVNGFSKVNGTGGAYFYNDGAVLLGYQGATNTVNIKSTDGSATFTGAVTAPNITSTFSGNGSSLTNLSAANLSGTLPALDASNLTNISVGTEGTFTPTWASGFSSPVYNGQDGDYYKLGQMVHFSFRLAFGSMPSYKSTGDALKIGGLPFNSNSNTNYIVVCSIGKNNYGGGFDNISANIEPGTSEIVFYDDFSTIASDSISHNWKYLVVSGTYMTD